MYNFNNTIQGGTSSLFKALQNGIITYLYIIGSSDFETQLVKTDTFRVIMSNIDAKKVYTLKLGNPTLILSKTNPFYNETNTSFSLNFMECVKLAESDFVDCNKKGAFLGSTFHLGERQAKRG